MKKTKEITNWTAGLQNRLHNCTQTSDNIIHWAGQAEIRNEQVYIQSTTCSLDFSFINTFIFIVAATTYEYKAAVAQVNNNVCHVPLALSLASTSIKGVG